MNTSLSIVLYQTNEVDLERLIACILQSEKSLTIHLIDNSPTDKLRFFEKTSSMIKYFHNPSNPGFGASHNLAIQMAMDANCKYHFVVNPDIYFTDEVISKMINFMNDHPDVGMMMPQVLNVDGTIQNLPKLLPSPLSILLRKFKKPSGYYNNFITKYELRFVPRDQIYNTPILSGCFTLFNLEALKKVGLYDDRFFMYFEDWDMSRRMHEQYKTLYFPNVSVYHGYESGASKSTKLFKVFIQSACSYFNKWGWFDKNRNIINDQAIAAILK